MRARLRAIFETTPAFAVIFAVTIAAAVMLKPSPASAQPVQYVKICDLYGAGFYYLPGTDTCVNVTTNDARDLTAGGEWRWRVPNNPWNWVKSPKKACRNGKLVKFGDITGADLTLDVHNRYVSNTQYPLNLKSGQYIASVLYKGGLSGTGVGAGNFCMYYYYVDQTNGPTYSFPLGCIDTASHAGGPATLQFTPDSAIPPSTATQVSVVGANGQLWSPASASDIQGTLSIWLCLQRARP
jgi:Porin subfamily